MTIEFTTANVESPVVEFTYPVDDLQHLFDKCKTWNSNEEFNGLGYKDLNKRLMCKGNTISSLAFDNFSRELENSKLLLIEKFLEIDTQNRWPNISKSISKSMTIYLSLITDLPGYTMSEHLDNRSVYAAGYLNIFDNESLTVINSTRKSFFGKTKEIEYQAPGEKGRGAIWLNTENSWHRVNPVSQDRKTLMMSFQIVPWH
jgi:hypothetical protein